MRWICFCLLALYSLPASAAQFPGTYTALTASREACNGAITAELRAANGDVWIGGSFTECFGQQRLGIARISGGTLAATVLPGHPSSVTAIVEFQGDLYFGGSGFDFGAEIGHTVMRYSGGNFMPIGLPQASFAITHAMAVYQDALYIGGRQEDGALLNRWSGSTLTTLPLTGTAFGSRVRALVVHDQKLYVGGLFRGCLVALDGNALVPASAQSLAPCPTLPSGVEGVNALASHAGALYIGGEFSSAGGTPVQNLVRLQQGGFLPLTAGPDNGVAASPAIARVYSLASFQNRLYIGGTFDTAGGHPVTNLAVYDGSFASPGGMPAVNGAVGMLQPAGPQLRIGGGFSVLGTQAISGYAQWDGLDYASVLPDQTQATGPNQAVSSLSVLSSGLVLTGSFTVAGEVPVAGFALSDGQQWTALPGRFDSETSARVIEFNGEWIAAGTFERIGGITANHMARFVGGAWQSLGAEAVPFGGRVNDLAVHAGKVYLAGESFRVGGQPCSRLLSWDGAQLQCVPTPAEFGATLHALEIHAGALYAAGNVVGSLDGSNWQMLPALRGSVTDLVSHRGMLYANAGTDTDSLVSRWDGENWLRAGFNSGLPCTSIVFCAFRMASYRGLLYATSLLSSSSPISAFDGRTWHPQATPNVLGTAIAFQDKLYLSSGSSVQSSYLATWEAPVESLFADGIE